MSEERRRVVMDPAIAAVLGDGRKRQRRRTMTPRQREQAERDAGRERVTLELNPDLMSMVRAIAQAEGISPAGAINRLLATAIEDYAADGIDFDECRRPSRSPRYKWVVELNGLEEVTQALSRKLELFSS